MANLPQWWIDAVAAYARVYIEHGETDVEAVRLGMAALTARFDRLAEGISLSHLTSLEAGNRPLCDAIARAVYEECRR